MLKSGKFIINLHFALLGFLLLAAHAYFYLPFITDDALISLRYARRFVDGMGLTWNDAEYVEGYSNLLWVLLAAALRWISNADWMLILRILGALFFSLVCLALSITQYPKAKWAPLCGILPLVSSATVAAWVMGGLEQPLVAALLAWSLLLVLPLCAGAPVTRALNLSLCFLFILQTWTRSDGAFWGVAIGLAVFCLCFNEKEKRASALLWIVATIAAFAAQTLFRLWYYDSFVSNVAHIKLGLTAMRLYLGGRYVGLGLALLFPLLVLVLISVVTLWRQRIARSQLLLLGSLCCGWLIYLVTIGGDVNPPFRHFVPIVVLLCFILREAGIALDNHPQSTQTLKREALSWGPAMLLLFLCFQILWAEHADARSEYSRGVRERMRLGESLQIAFPGKEPLVGVGAAGGLPFVVPWQVLDLLGLNDRHIALNPPAYAGHGWIGHDFGDPDYVMRRRPDILVLEESDFTQPFFYIDKMLLGRADFQEDYQLVHFFISAPWEHVATIWLSRSSKILGIQQLANEVRIPAYFCVGNSKTRVSLAEQAGLVLTLGPGENCSVDLGMDRDFEVQIESVSTLLPEYVFEGGEGQNRKRLKISNPHAETIHLRNITVKLVDRERN